MKEESKYCVLRIVRVLKPATIIGNPIREIYQHPQRTYLRSHLDFGEARSQTVGFRIQIQ